MKINVIKTPIESKTFVDLSIGTPFFENSWHLNDTDVDMMLMKCEVGINPENGSRFNAVYFDDGTFDWIDLDKEVFPVDARIEVKF